MIKPPPPTPPAKEKVDIMFLYGSQTGTAEVGQAMHTCACLYLVESPPRLPTLISFAARFTQ